MGEDKKKGKKWGSSGCDEDKYFCLLKNKTTLSIWVVGMWVSSWIDEGNNFVYKKKQDNLIMEDHHWIGIVEVQQ
jgi:hypothetical protein